MGLDSTDYLTFTFLLIHFNISVKYDDEEENQPNITQFLLTVLCRANTLTTFIQRQ